MTPQDDSNPPAGQPQDLGGGIRRVLAPNPSPMTYRGTNTYLLGTRALAVIDPGPDDDAHLAAILASLTPDQSISHILVTHSHLDHSPLAARLSAASGAPVLAYGDHLSGRSAVMQALAASGLVRGGEGVDIGFSPDQTVSDGEILQGDGWSLTAHWTPGHFGNHMCFAHENTVFTGDLVMGWASSLVSPPDGDLTDFMASCRKLQRLDAKTFHSGHGAPIDDPAGRMRWLIDHRLQRENSIRNHLAQTPANAAELTGKIYTDTPRSLIPAATRNVLAHLIDLHSRKLAQPIGPLSDQSTFELS